MVTTVKITALTDTLSEQFPAPSIKPLNVGPRDFNNLSIDLSEKTANGQWELTPASSFIRRHTDTPVAANDLVRSEAQKKSGFFMIDTADGI